MAQPEELEAQEQVADLQQQLAQDTLTTTITQMNQGGANGQPVSPQMPTNIAWTNVPASLGWRTRNLMSRK